jgi:hypothetical protein
VYEMAMGLRAGTLIAVIVVAPSQSFAQEPQAPYAGGSKGNLIGSIDALTPYNPTPPMVLEPPRPRRPAIEFADGVAEPWVERDPIAPHNFELAAPACSEMEAVR